MSTRRRGTGSSGRVRTRSSYRTSEQLGETVIRVNLSEDVSVSTAMTVEPVCFIDLTEEIPRSSVTLSDITISVHEEPIDLCSADTDSRWKNSPSRKRRHEDDGNENQTKKPNAACPVCLEDLDFDSHRSKKQVVSTKCGHLFCSMCITTVLRNTKQCPVCRKKQLLRDTHPIFL